MEASTSEFGERTDVRMAPHTTLDRRPERCARSCCCLSLSSERHAFQRTMCYASDAFPARADRRMSSSLTADEATKVDASRPVFTYSHLLSFARLFLSSETQRRERPPSHEMIPPLVAPPPGGPIPEPELISIPPAAPPLPGPDAPLEPEGKLGLAKDAIAWRCALRRLEASWRICRGGEGWDDAVEVARR